MRNKKKKELIVIILSFFVFLFLLYSYNQKIYYNEKQIFYLVKIFYTLLFLSWYFIQKSLINPIVIFFLCTLIFYFGQYIAYFFKGNLSGVRTILTTYSTELYSQLALYSLLSLSLIYISVVFFEFLNIQKNHKNYKVNIIDKKALKKTSLTLLIVSYIPGVITQYIYAKIALTMGYSAIYSSSFYKLGGINGIIKFFGTYTFFSLLLSLISFKETKYFKYVVLLTYIYIILNFLSGARFGSIIFIITLLMVKKYVWGGISKRQVLRIFIYGIVLVFLMSIISLIREDIGKLKSFKSLFEILFKHNILYRIFEEFGFTAVANATVYEYTPNVIEYGNGKTYIAGIMLIFPNLFWEVHPYANINIDIMFNTLLSDYGGMGSSFLAEAYYNYGTKSLYLMPLFGWLLSKININLNKIIKSKKLINAYIYLSLFNIFLAYIRSDTVTFFRKTTYFIGFVYLLFCIFRDIRSSKLKEFLNNE